MSVFFVNYRDGRVAARRQLVAARLIDERGDAVAPWHPIQGPSDASTMWYALMRKQERGIFIGTLCIRHGSRLASMVAAGWQEVPLAEIGPEARAPGPRRGQAMKTGVRTSTLR